LAKETCLSVNAQGILAIQHQLVVDTTMTTNNHASDEPTSVAFCDFLLLPMVEDLDNDNEYGPEHDETNNNGDRSRTVSSHSQTQLFSSQRTEDERSAITTQTQPSQRKAHKRQRLLASHDSDNDHSSNGARLPIGSDAENSSNDEEDALDHNSRSTLLFPPIGGRQSQTGRGVRGSGGDSNFASSSMNASLDDEEDGWIRNRRLDQRKRQRRATQLFEQQTHTREESTTQNYHKENDHTSVNLLDDSGNESSPSPPSPDAAVSPLASMRDTNHSHSRRRDSEDDEEDEEQYCSSPEIIYGQT
jgi:hypothetical protein